LVQVAFETNRPIYAFAILLGAFKTNYQSGNLKRFLAQREPCRWTELFDQYANKMPFGEPDYGNPISESFFRLDRYATSKMTINEKMSHPVLGHFIQLWGELERQDIAYRLAFTAPNGYRKQIQKLMQLFVEPIRVIKFTIGAENIVVVAGNLQFAGFYFDSELTLTDRKAMLMDFLTMYGTVRSFSGALMAKDFRLCHHTACPHYERNLCNMWTSIPIQYESCNFETRLKRLLVMYGSDESEMTWTPHVLVGGSPDVWPNNMGARLDHGKVG
jgi:hypothetical protein